MIRNNKSPEVKPVGRNAFISKARTKTPQKKAPQMLQSRHKHTISTPNPPRSSSPPKPKIVNKKPSQSLISFQKIDLRKGIFSNKQIFVKNQPTKATPASILKLTDTPQQPCIQNKYQVLSKEFKIDKNLFVPRKVESKDTEGYYIPEKPPLIHEDNNTQYS